jgi:DNA-nicking Smr family endonuclease
MKHNKLDLHGVRHHEVRNKVIRLVEDNWGEGLNVEIITGNSDEMKSIVGNVLDEYHLDYKIGTFFNKNTIITTP